MEGEISGLGAALKNANDAQSVVDTGEAALNEIHTLLLRMRELAVTASSDTATESDRAALNTEVSALETEIDRIGSSTTWGGIQLLDGTYSDDAPIVFQIGPRSGNTVSFSLLQFNFIYYKSIRLLHNQLLYYTSNFLPTQTGH